VSASSIESATDCEITTGTGETSMSPPPPSPSGSGVAPARPACTRRISSASTTMSVVVRTRPSISIVLGAVEYTGAIASTPGTSANAACCSSVNGVPVTAASAPTRASAARSTPVCTVPSSTAEKTATETPTTTVSTGTMPADGSRNARAEPRNGTRSRRRLVRRTRAASGTG